MNAVALVGAALLAVLVLRGRNPSDNFTWDEMTVTSTGLSNEPNSEQKAYMTRLAREVLEPLRAEFGPLRLTSSFRSVAVNQKVGGVSNSDHLTGRAADLYAVNGASTEDMAAWLYRNPSIPIRQVVVYPETTGHLHVALDSGGTPYAREFLRKHAARQPNGKFYSTWKPRGSNV